jgi:hypothetical protein
MPEAVTLIRRNTAKNKNEDFEASKGEMSRNLYG